MPEETISQPRSAAREEAAKQAVVLGFTIISLIVYYYMQRKTGEDFAQAQRNASDADFARSQRMTWAKRMERAYARAAGWCWRQAEKARVSYEKDRA